MSIIHAKNFSFTYPGLEEKAIDGVSFEIEPNEVVGLIGPIGAGKTTLCMAIAGVAPSVIGGETSGELTVAYQKRTEDSGMENTGKVGMVFENFGSQLVQLKVLDEVMTPLENRGFSEQEAKERAREILRQVGLHEDMEGKQLWDLAQGQQQRVAVAATLAMDPPILIFDTVTDKLDPEGQEKIRNVIKAQADGKKTAIIVERDPHFLRQVVDRILVLVDGKIVAQGKTDEILSNYDLLSRADIEPTLSLRAARALGIPGSPLTPEDFDRVAEQAKRAVNGDEQGNRFRFSHPIARAVGLREYVEESNDKEVQAENNFSQPLVRIEDVTYGYSDETKVLDDLNITICAGEVHALMGASGAGKTTTIKLVNGLLQSSKGKVLVCDDEITKDTEVGDLALKVATVFQNPDDAISERTVKEEIAFPLQQRQYQRTSWFSKQKCYDDDHIENRVSHACKLVGIDDDLLDRDPTLLPYGQRKLVTIAEALTLDPKVLLLDEPIIGLGASSRHKIRQTIRQFAEEGKAVLLVSNDVDFVAEVADTVTILERGRALMQGSLHEVFAEDNWERLGELHMYPPRTTQLAQRYGTKALSCDELVSNLSSSR
ncbi:MAG: ATP-binding cassette domain-containing protein [Kastovskya adunca ATA6-11-RM4]|jgi:energy-coupling factor transport system ATP-binding protein|nr:ATP-binding cassette domain-containing protein [Kastovskya adunca ATA6-11-RM4]